MVLLTQLLHVCEHQHPAFRQPRQLRDHISETPKPSTLILWQSWLRHEVPLNRAEGNRISVSFNYVLA